MNYYTLNLGFSLDSLSTQTAGFLDPVVTSLDTQDLSTMSKLWLLSTEPPTVNGPFQLIETEIKPVVLQVGDVAYVRVFYVPDGSMNCPDGSALTLRVSVVFGTLADNDGNPKTYRTPFTIVNTNTAQAVFHSSDLSFDETNALLVRLGTVTKGPGEGELDQYTFIAGVAVTNTDQTWGTSAEYTFGHDPEMDVGT